MIKRTIAKLSNMTRWFLMAVGLVYICMLMGGFSQDIPTEVHAGGEAGIIIMVVQVLKGVLPDKKWINNLMPMLSIVIGIMIGLLTHPTIQAGIYHGIVAGLASTGLYRAGKIWKEKEKV